MRGTEIKEMKGKLVDDSTKSGTKKPKIIKNLFGKSKKEK